MSDPELPPRASDRAAAAAVPLLRGRHFGLVTERPDSAEAALFRQAAMALGARVAFIRPSVAGLLRGADDVDDTARWLGRLYDAIECQGLAADRVSRVRACAGVPVFDNLAAASVAEPGLETPLQRLQAALLGLFR